MAKIADNIFCGANTVDQLLINWERVLSNLSDCNLKLSPSQTIICPKTVSILGWQWSGGNLTVSKHRVSALSKCSLPSTVKQLRSFIGAFKVLSRVLPHCSKFMSPLDAMTAGKSSSDKLS